MLWRVTVKNIIGEIKKKAKYCTILERDIRPGTLGLEMISI